MTQQPIIMMAIADPAIAQRFAAPIMAHVGADVSIYNSGQKLLSQLEYTSPDLIIVEAGLPDIFGFEVIERVKNDHANATIPIILLGSVSRPYRYHRPPAAMYGADAYMEPNVAIPSFVTIVKRLLTRRPPTHHSKPSAHSVPPPALSITSLPEAEKYARLMITDIVIKVIHSHSDGNAKQLDHNALRRRLMTELESASQNFLTRLPESIRSRLSTFSTYQAVLGLPATAAPDMSEDDS